MDTRIYKLNVSRETIGNDLFNASVKEQGRVYI